MPESITGKKMKYKLGPEREADHIWWISNINKARNHYAGWDIKIGIEDVFKDIYEALNRK